jgi:hypothetical protein
MVTGSESRTRIERDDFSPFAHFRIWLFPARTDNEAVADGERMIKLFPVFGPIFVSDVAAFRDLRADLFERGSQLPKPFFVLAFEGKVESPLDIRIFLVDLPPLQTSLNQDLLYPGGVVLGMLEIQYQPGLFCSGHGLIL